MKRGRLLHAELAGLIASLGHGDRLVLGDAGLPVPDGVRRIDLAVSPGTPPLLDVLAAVLDEMAVQRCVLAIELGTRSPAMHEGIRALLPDVTTEHVPHDEFKRLCRGARAVVRTGEFTPYANVILEAGVVF